MDSYKTKVIKATQTVSSGRAVPLSNALHPARPTPGAKPDSKPQPPDATAIAQQAVQDAYNKGMAAGAASKGSQVASAVEALGQATRSLPQLHRDIVAKGEEQIVKLALAIAEKIIHTEVATRKDIISGVLKNALKSVADTEGMKIRLNPQDFRYMMEVKKDFLQSFDGIRNVMFEEDQGVKRGGAIIETAFGEVDARLESQLKEIRQAMLKTETKKT